MVQVHEWAEIRHMKFVDGLSIREIERRTGRHRDTIRRALESSDPPKYQRKAQPSKLDLFKPDVLKLLDKDASIPSQRIRVEGQVLQYDKMPRLRSPGQHPLTVKPVPGR